MTSTATPWRAPRYRISMAACHPYSRSPRAVSARKAPSALRPPTTQYLDALTGKWDMRGTLGGQPVRYHAFAERVLMGGFRQSAHD